MLGAVLVLLLIPFINSSKVRSTTFRPLFRIFFWLFIADFIILSWIGQQPMRDIYVFVGQVATAYYFFFFLVLIPVLGKIELELVYYEYKQERKKNQDKKTRERIRIKKQEK